MCLVFFSFLLRSHQFTWQCGQWLATWMAFQPECLFILVAEGQKIIPLSCCELCCKLTTAVRDLPTKTLSLSITSSLQASQIWSHLCSHWHCFLQARHFHTPYQPRSYKFLLKLPCPLYSALHRGPLFSFLAFFIIPLKALLPCLSSCTTQRSSNYKT